MERSALYALLIAVVGYLVAACHQITEYPQQPKVSKVGTVASVMVQVNYVSIAELNSLMDGRKVQCSHRYGELVYGCADISPLLVLAGVCPIYVVHPDRLDAFNQVVMLAILGHEFLHCLGWRH